MNRTGLLAFLIFASASEVTINNASAAGVGEGEWVMYAQDANGDVHFYDPSQVEKIGMQRRVLHGVRYRTSVMGASSFSSLMEIDCFEWTEKALQRTYFIDEHWLKAAMKTDTTEKPKRSIVAGSSKAQLAEIVCD
jgi:hypothetical protein